MAKGTQLQLQLQQHRVGRIKSSPGLIQRETDGIVKKNNAGERDSPD